MAKYAALLLLTGALSACGDSGPEIPAQKWRDIDIRVEARPNPPRVGMNEFLVLATAGRGRPAYDLVVSLRTSDGDEWKQMIEDGQVGVYRRAAEVAPGERSVLQVQIKRKDDVSVLRFPLNVSP